jgi:hypothetical protein
MKTGPLGVAQLVRLLGPLDVGLAAVGELGLVTFAAIGAGDQQHVASSS